MFKVGDKVRYTQRARELYGYGDFVFIVSAGTDGKGYITDEYGNRRTAAYLELVQSEPAHKPSAVAPKQDMVPAVEFNNLMTMYQNLSQEMFGLKAERDMAVSRACSLADRCQILEDEAKARGRR